MNNHMTQYPASCARTKFIRAITVITWYVVGTHHLVWSADQAQAAGFFNSNLRLRLCAVAQAAHKAQGQTRLIQTSLYEGLLAESKGCSVGQQFVARVLDVWTELDTLRAIAQKDRQYMYKDVIKTYLDLYGSLYLLISCVEQRLAERDMRDVEQLLQSIVSAHNDIFASPQNAEEHCAQGIMSQVCAVWDSYRLLLDGKTAIQPHLCW